MNGSDLNPELGGILQCPEHAAPLEPEGDALHASCGCRYPLKDGIPRIFDALDPETRRTIEGFQFQWEQVGHTSLNLLDDPGERGLFLDFLGQPEGWWAGKRVLDAGCGLGWFAQLVAGMGAQVVAVDLTGAVDIAARRNPGANPAYVQADLTRLPFRDSVFDYVYCYCVIQHTRDTQAVLRHLVRSARPGAPVAVTHYGPIRVFRQIYDAGRLLISRMPLGMLYALSHLAIPLAHVPLLRHVCYPGINPRQDPRRRVLDTFDWYHAGHQRYTTQPELEEWMTEAGLTGVEGGLKIGVAARGTRP